MSKSKRHEGWVDVDMDGLARLIRRKGLAFIVNELAQNGWDTAATWVKIDIASIPNRAAITLTVTDNDPDGFHNLTHAYTMFAESEKKGDPSKRGRFNLGEKLVLAACTSAVISSTTGTVRFDRDGKKLTRTQVNECRDEGSEFSAEIRMTRAELDGVMEATTQLLPPIPTFINGKQLPSRKPTHTFTTTLPTEKADEEGYLKRTARKTEVRVYKPWDGVSHLYEMGIPVVDTELPWTIEIDQKIPLNSDRDNVSPAYLRQVGVLVVNEMHKHLSADEASLPSVIEALGDSRITDGAVNTILTHQYGKKRTVFDPSDPEANNKAFAHGHNVIPGRAFGSSQWKNIKRAGVVQASGKVFPSPRPYDPDGDQAKTLPKDKWTPGIVAVEAFAKAFAQELMDVRITVTMENEFTQGYVANYGHQHLVFNVPRLSKKWFNLETNALNVIDLLIHEFGHQYASNHLSTEYYHAVTKLGAKATMLALRKPEFFRAHGISFGSDTEAP